MIELIEHSCMALDELMDVMGRASIEAVLELSPTQVAWPLQKGKARATACCGMEGSRAVCGEPATFAR
jgi:hypothetical protein